MYTHTSQELRTLFEQGAQFMFASSGPGVKDAVISVPGGRWLLVPMKTDEEELGRTCFFDLSAAVGEATQPCTLFETQNCDLSTMSFSGMQLETDSSTLAFTFAQVYRVRDDNEDPVDSPWVLHVWRVQEVSDTLHAECLQTMRLGSLEDAEARVVLYHGSLRDDMLAFSINMESDDFSIVMVANWKEVGDDEERYQGKIFPRIGDRQQLESLTLLPDSQLLLSSTSGQVSTIDYASLTTSLYPEYDGSLLTETEIIQTPFCTSTDSHPKEQMSARSVDTTLSSTIFPSYKMPTQRAIQCQ